MSGYYVPLECGSDEDVARLVHADLSHLNLDELDHEYARVLVALAECDRQDIARRWLIERVRQVRAEIVRRRGRR